MGYVLTPLRGYSSQQDWDLGGGVDEKTSGCLKQTAIGCGVLIVIAIAFPLVMAVKMMTPFNRAVDSRHAIEEVFGPQES